VNKLLGENKVGSAMTNSWRPSLKRILHLWKDECVFKMGHLCRKNV